MSAFVRYSGSQIALPTLDVAADREELLDGVRLIRSLSMAAWQQPVLCLLKSRGMPAESDAVRFTPERAGEAGTDAVMVSFQHALSATEVRDWSGQWRCRPDAIDGIDFGWRSLRDAFLGDWSTFVHRIEACRAGLSVPIIALNGRYAPWIPAAHRGGGRSA